MEMGDAEQHAASASPPAFPPVKDEEDERVSPPPKPVKKRIRKPRGRGLRTKTGCLTCRKRHKKCDEQLPICSHCVTSNRECVWPDPNATDVASGNSSQAQSPPGSTEPRSEPGGLPPTSHSAIAVETPSLSLSQQRWYQRDPPSLTSTTSNSPQQSSPAAALSPGDAAEPEARVPRPAFPPVGPVAPTLDYHFPNGPSADSHDIVDPALAALYPGTRPKPPISDLAPTSSHGHTPTSPETVSSVGTISAGLASTKWLDLLAGDAAAQANGQFSLGAGGPLQADLHNQAADTPGSGSGRGTFRGDGLRISNSSFGVMGKLDWAIPERYPWQEVVDLELGPVEASLFRGFAEKSALWLDLFDSYRHFSTYVIRLALRNVGLMKAILALQARYASLGPAPAAAAAAGAYKDRASPTPAVDQTDAVRYYHEALHYVSRALQYQSYTHSEELLGTALVISTYEMLEAHMCHRIGWLSPGQRSSVLSNWQRHLKGVFWIQRAQDVNGATGGLRQAVWWAWLRQDLWAAFREHRRCLSYWRPVVDYPDLTQSELADRAVYLLSQAVNYCADDPELGSLAGAGILADRAGDVDDAVHRRAERGVELMEMLERWRSFIGDGFRPLPTAPRPPGEKVGLEAHGWRPLWIHPPQFAVALQVYHFARILVSLHRPAMSGPGGHAEIEKTLSESVATICGIAMELTDQGYQLMSAQCLFGAGLCVRDAAQQDGIMALMKECEAKSGWPTAAMRSDLRGEWRRRDTEMTDV